MTNASQSMNEREINQINLSMRQQPWYQKWFLSRGLNPNRVKLNEQQRADLANTAAANGFRLGDRMKIDEAGNINQNGGFAGMPTWAKIAISAAPVAGAMMIPGVREATLGQLGGLFGGSSAPAAAGGTTAATASAPAVGAIEGGIFGGGAAASSGFGLSDILMASLSPAIGTIGGIYMNRAQTNAAREAAEAQTSSANYAADLQSKGASEQLAWLREQDAAQRSQFDRTQQMNYELAQEEMAYSREMAERQARLVESELAWKRDVDKRRYSDLSPYRSAGTGSLFQMGQPIRNISQRG